MGSLLLIREQDSCVTEDWNLRALLDQDREICTTDQTCLKLSLNRRRVVPRCKQGTMPMGMEW
jgi:hypothetical protein